MVLDFCSLFFTDMYALQKAKQQAATSLKKAIGKGATISVEDLETPPNPEMGDLAFPCFTLAKKRAKSPADVARELAAKIGSSELIEKAKAVGPYVNFIFNKAAFSTRVLKEVRVAGKKYGNGTSGKGTKVVVEGADPNTHKIFHIGHILDALYTQAIANVLKANSYEVVFASYIGDSGADVAKAVWGFNKYHDGSDVAEGDRAKYLGEIYTRATKEVHENEEIKKEIQEVQRALEKKKEPWEALYQKTRKWSMDEFKKVFSELNVKPDAWYFEREVESPGKELVKKMLTDGVAKKSDGAVVVDLEDEDLKVFLILKSDGSALYATMDLYLAMKKEEDHAADRLIIVTDVRQSFYFKQLFATLKRIGLRRQLLHLPHGMVTLPEGAMSSREGTIVSYEELKSEMLTTLKKETSSRHKDWDDEKIEKTAAAINSAAIAFMMLRQDTDSNIVFDMKEATSFDGFTGPYLLYSIARIESVKRKAKAEKVRKKTNPEKLTHPLEARLVRKLADLPDVVARAAQSYQVSGVAVWAFETAKLFSEYYHEVKIVNVDDKTLSGARLALVGAVRQGLENAMKILTIEPINEM